MSEPQPMPYAPPPRRRRSPGGEILISLVSAGLFLYVGYGLGLRPTEGAEPLYAASVRALVWGARLVGFAILAVMVLSQLRVPGTALIDLLIAVLATGLCAVVGLIWVVHHDMDGFLLLLFALLNGSATKAAWLRWSRPWHREEGD